MTSSKGQKSIDNTYGWIEEQIKNIFTYRVTLGHTYAEVYYGQSPY